MSLPNESLRKRSEKAARRGNILDSATVYLSGPMDFVASREEERAKGWRTRISQFLRSMGTTIYDPWEKPEVSGMKHYGKEDEFTVNRRDAWTYDDTDEGRRTRDELCAEFWPTLHIDLRMTDLADFIIAYCPTNIYSVGTVHEIATARLQHKPVLLVTPRVDLDALPALDQYMRGLNDGGEGSRLLEALKRQVPLRANPTSAPSLWYMAMLEHEDYFFDGFGFHVKSRAENKTFAELMGWDPYDLLDDRELRNPPRRPLLPYLESLNEEIPKRFDSELGKEIENPEWLIFADEDVRPHGVT